MKNKNTKKQNVFNNNKLYIIKIVTVNQIDVYGIKPDTFFDIPVIAKNRYIAELKVMKEFSGSECIDVELVSSHKWTDLYPTIIEPIINK